MFFDSNEEIEKQLKDIKFKRKAVFADDTLEIDIKSTPISNKRVDGIDIGCQADLQPKTIDSTTQTRNKKNKEVQTDSTDSVIIENNQNINYDAILKLLRRKLYIVEECLTENNQSNAFKNYDVNWNDQETTITNPFTLIHQQLVKDEELEVTSVAWNCRGGTICVGYGRFDHESICTHKGALCTWNIDLIKLKQDKPDVCIETSYCVTAVAPHPEFPGIIAIGLFNGEIIVHDVRENDSLVASILDKNDLHSDEITYLKWIREPNSSKKKFFLLSCSRDGKVLIWNALPTKKQLKLHDGFLIVNKSDKYSDPLSNEIGVSALSINNEDRNIFLAGTDVGGLYKCSFSSTSTANSKWMEALSVALKNPINLSYDANKGPIYSISSSPFHRNLFLTCGTDSEIKLYSLLQSSPLLHLCPNQGYLYSISWSKTRPCVFACGTNKGQILFYDLAKTTSSSLQTIQASDKPIYTLEFNKKRSGYLATGDGSGHVKIWCLSSNLVNQDIDELKKLNKLSEKPFEL